MKPRFVKILDVGDSIAWWQYRNLVGKTFEILEVSEHNYGKIEYEEDYFGWLYLDMHEVNPHLKIEDSNI